MPARYRVDDAKVVWRIADDEAVVLHADSSAYFGLNQIGTRLWSQLANHSMALEELTMWARSYFSDVPEGLAEELAMFIDELVELNLIESEEGFAPHAMPETTHGSAPPPWEAPAVERFGDLEKLILSGE
jgi:hypothetical protein